MSSGTFIVFFDVSARGLTGILVEVEVGLMGVFPLGLAIAVSLVAKAGPQAVIDGQVRDFLNHDPAVAIAADARHSMAGLNRPVRDESPSALLENIEIDCEAAGIIPEGVSKGVPAGDGDNHRQSAGVGRSTWRRAGVFRKGSGAGGIRAGVYEETVARRTRPRVEDVVLQKASGVVVDRRVPVKPVVEVGRG